MGFIIEKEAKKIRGLELMRSYSIWYEVEVEVAYDTGFQQEFTVFYYLCFFTYLLLVPVLVVFTT